MSALIQKENMVKFGESEESEVSIVTEYSRNYIYSTQ